MLQPSHLTSLPFELLESICINLPTVTLCSVALTCHTLHPVAISCIHSTITIAPVPGNSKRSKSYHPDPHTLALRLLADPSLGARVRNFTYTNTSATTIVSPRRTLPGLATCDNSYDHKYTNLAPLIDHLYTASHLSTHARTFPNDLSAAADALIHWHHYLRCGAAQYTAVFCLTLTPHLRSLDITWAGVGPCAAFAGPSWLRTALPQLETLIVRACGPRGKNGRKGWYRNEEWTFPEWAAGGALAAGHPSLKRVEFCDGSAAELGAAAVAAAEAEAEAASVLESLELSGCGMPPARLAEVLRVAARNCARVEEVRVGLVHPITVPFAYPSMWPVPYSKRKTVVRLGEVGDALRGLLGPVPGSGEGGRGGFDSWLHRTVGHSKLRTMSVKLDFITPKGSVRCAGGGEVGYNGVEWGVSGRLGTLRGFEKLQYLEVSWVVLVGWSLASLQKEVAEDELPGGYLGSVLPDGLKWLTVSDEMASWPAWEWRPVEVVELIREWLSLGKRRGLQGVVWKLKNRNEGFGGTWAWTYYAIQEMKSISERAGVICQFDLGRI